MTFSRFRTFVVIWCAAVLLALSPAVGAAQGSCYFGVCNAPYSNCFTWCFEVYETSDFWDPLCPSCYCRQGCCFHYEGPPTCEFLCGGENYARCRAGSCDTP